MAYSDIGTALHPLWVEVTPQDIRDLQSVSDHIAYRNILRRNHHQQYQHHKENSQMATTRKTAASTPATVEIDMVKFLTDLGALVDAHLNGAAPAPAPAKSKVKPSADVEPEESDEDEEETEEEDERRVALNKKTLTALKKEAVSRGFDKDEVDGASKEDIIDSIIEDMDENDGAEDEAEEDEEVDEAEESDEETEDEEEGDEEESEWYTEDDLNPLGLVALKKIAKEEAGYAVADLKGKDKEEVIALIVAAGDEDAEEESEEEEDEDEEITEEDLKEMSLAELKSLAKEYGIKVKPGSKSPTIIKQIMSA